MSGKLIEKWVNRQPTLHEYSIYALKLRLVDQDAIGYPSINRRPRNRKIL